MPPSGEQPLLLTNMPTPPPPICPGWAASRTLPIAWPEPRVSALALPDVRRLSAVALLHDPIEVRARGSGLAFLLERGGASRHQSIAWSFRLCRREPRDHPCAADLVTDLRRDVPPVSRLARDIADRERVDQICPRLTGSQPATRDGHVFGRGLTTRKPSARLRFPGTCHRAQQSVIAPSLRSSTPRGAPLRWCARRCADCGGAAGGPGSGSRDGREKSIGPMDRRPRRQSVARRCSRPGNRQAG
jgi:hypothetical protein